MQIEHLGKRPVLDATVVIAPTAVISGDVHIEAGTVLLAGAILSAQGAPVRIGQHCIVMEHAVVRGAGQHPCTLGNHVLVGPHAHITGYGNQPFGVIENVVVSETRRGTGAGSRLMEHAEAVCREHDCSKMMLLSAAARAQAHRFFERHGFSSASKRAFVKYRRQFQHP